MYKWSQNMRLWWNFETVEYYFYIFWEIYKNSTFYFLFFEIFLYMKNIGFPSAAWQTIMSIFYVIMTEWLQVVPQPTFLPKLVSKCPFFGGWSTNFGGFWWIFGRKIFWENIQSIIDNKIIYNYITLKHKKTWKWPFFWFYE